MRFRSVVGRVITSVHARLLTSWAVPILVLVLQSGCGGGSDTTGGPSPCTVSGVTVSASAATIDTGATATLTAAVSASGSCTGVTWAATPAGGTLTASGLSATFRAATPGTYTIAATSTADGSRSGSAVVTVTAPASMACGTANGTVTTHSSNISADETWAGDGVTHRVPNSITINGNAVVTIQPCAIVALSQGVTINVGGNSHLVAAGTSSTRFVTFKRDVAGQAWGTLRGVSPTALIDLAWTFLIGGGNFGLLNDPTIAAFGNGYAVAPVGVIRVNNVTIQGSQGVGVYLDANAAFTSDSRLLTITGSGGRPINTTMMALGSVPSGGSYAGNATDEILIFGPNANVFADMTVDDYGVPVRIPYSTMLVAPPAGNTNPVTLTLKPGVVFRFPKVGGQPGARVTFGTNGNDPNNVVGVLNAMGTAAKPIVFTSGEAVPAPGDWVGLWLNTATGSRLDHVEISYAGAASSIVSANCRLANTPDNAALLVGDFSPQYVPPSDLITNSRITNSAGYGIDAIWQTGTYNTPDLTATNTFSSNARCRQTYNGITPPGTCPLGGGCTVP